MKSCINKVTIAGYLYQHSLAVKTVQNQQSKNFGKEFINGTIEIATDDSGLNVIPVRFTYVTPTNNSGNVNRTYAILKNIIDGAPTWIENGRDEALKVQCDTAFALNDFYAQDGQLVSQMVQEGGFVSIIDNLPADEDRNKFALDLLITNVAHVDADPEKNITEDYCTVRGASFNFRNALLPMAFKVTNPQGMTFFEDSGASGAEPLFIKVWGKVYNKTVKVNKVEETAFGDNAVTSYERKVKEWVITNAAKAAYDYGDESVLTAADVTKAMQDRQVYLADLKRQQDEYKANKAANGFATAAPVAPKASTTSFDF